MKRSDEDERAARMKEREYFHALKVLPGAWCVIRVDGRGFSRFTETHFEKPFDARFHDAMVKTAEALLTELQALYVYTESDEISVLLPRECALFGREVEKLISVSAGIASAHFALAVQQPAHFDGRIWMAARDEEVVDYFMWRQSDCTRAALNGWCYWMLRKEGKGQQEATRALHGATFSQKNELLFTRGVNFNEVPLWQRRGVALRFESYERETVHEGKMVQSTRRRVKVDDALPMGEAYAEYVMGMIREQ